MLLCHTGALLAAGNVKLPPSRLALMRAAEGPLLVPSPVLGEIGYLLQSRVGPHAEVTFLKSFGGNGFHVAEVEERRYLAHHGTRRAVGEPSLSIVGPH
jgi:hypothetical protein